MKTLVALLLILLMLVSGYAWLQRARAEGSTHLLEVMQSIKPGCSKEEVLAIMGGEGQKISAESLPYWLANGVPERAEGEYWYYYMGFPSQNLVIYFGADGRVAFTTWVET